MKDFQRAHGGGAPSFNSEFFEYFLHVLFYGGLRDAQNRRDVRVGLTLAQPEQGFRSAGCETELQQGLSRGEIRLELALSLSCGTAQARFDRLDEIVIGDRLGQVIICPEIHAAAEIIFFPFSRKKNEWD